VLQQGGVLTFSTGAILMALINGGTKHECT
jgi:hypothetical protein